MKSETDPAHWCRSLVAVRLSGDLLLSAKHLFVGAMPPVEMARIARRQHANSGLAQQDQQAQMFHVIVMFELLCWG
jgi:hypothetical protein